MTVFPLLVSLLSNEHISVALQCYLEDRLRHRGVPEPTTSAELLDILLVEDDPLIQGPVVRALVNPLAPFVGL